MNDNKKDSQFTHLQTLRTKTIKTSNESHIPHKEEEQKEKDKNLKAIKATNQSCEVFPHEAANNCPWSPPAQ